MTDYTRYPTDILPLPQLSGYSIDEPSGITRVAMVSGRTRNRRKWYGQPAKLPGMTFIVSGEQLETFRGWVKNILDGGAAQFVFPVKQGTGVVDHLCKFVSDPKTKCLAPNLWSITVDIEIDALATQNENQTISAIEQLDDAAATLETGLDTAVTEYVTP